MSWTDRLKNLFRADKLDGEIGEEIEFHLEARFRDNIRAGMPPSEARQDAARRFGSRMRSLEGAREANLLVWIETVRQDIRYAFRTLVKNRGFTAVAVASLALGIGANTAIFTLINALVLKPLPIANPDGLLQLLQGTPRGPLNKWTFASFDFFRAQPQLFAGVIAQDSERFDVSFGEEPTPVEGVFVSGDYFSVLGVAPFAGRSLTPTDDTESGGASGPAVVLSYNFWVAHFAADSSVVGRTLVVNNTPLRIVGIMPASFFGIEVGRSPNLFVPLRLEPVLQGSRSLLHQKYAWWLDVLARPRDGLSAASFQSGLAAIWPRLIRDIVPFSPSRAASANARNGISDLRKRFVTPLYILMAIAGVVLIIACANVANLLLARVRSREREVAVRLAVGASRARILRQLLTESLLLSALGSLLGLAFAYWGAASCSHSSPADFAWSISTFIPIRACSALQRWRLSLPRSASAWGPPSA